MTEETARDLLSRQARKWVGGEEWPLDPIRIKKEGSLWLCESNADSEAPKVTIFVDEEYVVVGARVNPNWTDAIIVT